MSIVEVQGLRRPAVFVRVTNGPMASDESYGPNGAFTVDSPDLPGWRLFIIMSDGSDRPTGMEPWEHVSVSARARRNDRIVTRIPTWEEMAWVKAQCWPDEACVIQYHPPASRYVNQHPHVLHLWRPVDDLIPMPPVDYV